MLDTELRCTGLMPVPAVVLSIEAFKLDADLILEFVVVVVVVVVVDDDDDAFVDEDDDDDDADDAFGEDNEIKSLDLDLTRRFPANAVGVLEEGFDCVMM